MVKLNLDDFCQGGCPEFKAIVEYAPVYQCLDDSRIAFTDTVISCKHRDRCRHLMAFLKSKEVSHEHHTSRL